MTFKYDLLITVIGLSDYRNGRYKVLVPINRNHCNFRENNAFFFGERAFNTNCPKLGKLSPICL